MAIKFHRCGNLWIKVDGHPCWRVQKALDAAGVEYEIVKEPLMRGSRKNLIEHTHQNKLPAIEFEDGTWYRDESKEMVARISKGELIQPSPSADRDG